MSEESRQESEPLTAKQYVKAVHNIWSKRRIPAEDDISLRWLVDEGAKLLNNTADSKPDVHSLKVGIRDLQQTLVDKNHEIYGLKSEVERLKAENEELSEAMGNWCARSDKAEAKVDRLKKELADEVERLKATCHALRQSATAVTNYDGKVATWPEIASLIRDERDACGLSA